MPFTKSELQKIIALTDSKMNPIRGMIFDINTDIRHINEKIDTLTTKDQFYTWADKMLSELMSLRDEYILLRNRMSKSKKPADF